MATGSKGLAVRKKTWNVTYSPGTTVVYTIPSDVISAKVFINKIEGLNIDPNEGISLSAQRLVNGTWLSYGGIASLNQPTLGNANDDLGLYVSYSFPSGSVLSYGIAVSESILSGTNASGSFTLTQMMPGDRIVAIVTTSGETFTVDGFIVEETAPSSSI